MFINTLLFIAAPLTAQEVAPITPTEPAKQAKGWQIDVGYINVSVDEEGGEDLAGFNFNARKLLSNPTGAVRTSFEFGISNFSRSETYTSGPYSQTWDVTAFEFRAGVDAAFIIPESKGHVQPYVGAGLSYISADASTYGARGSAEDTSSDVGLYAKLGLRVLFKPEAATSPFLDLGFRKTFGHEDDYDGSLDYTALIASVGVSF